MKETVNFCDFLDRFNDYDRSDNFSYAGKQALFDYLEQYEEETGTELELDIIALCCEFTEYESFEAFQAEHPDIDDIEDYTIMIPIADSDGFIIADF
jgi:hypothetical protein